MDRKQNEREPRLDDLDPTQSDSTSFVCHQWLYQFWDTEGISHYIEMLAQGEDGRVKSPITIPSRL